MLTVLALLLSLLLSQASYYFLPRTLQSDKRSWHSWLLQHCGFSVIFLSLHLLTQSPFISTALTLSLLNVLIIINNAKYRALQEPLLFSDAYLYIQVLRHPRLFLPFLNIPVVVTACLIATLAFYFLIQLENQYLSINTSLFFASLSTYWQIILLLIGLYLSHRLAKNSALSFNPGSDVRQHGLFNSLVIYTVQAYYQKQNAFFAQTLSKHSAFADIQRTQKKSGALHSSRLNNSKKTSEVPPDLLIIQSESFFDARRLCPRINPQLFRHFDQIKLRSLQQGTLKVPAWGANTLRSEFSLLTGMPLQPLQHFQFHPYAYLPCRKNMTIPALPAYLQQLGYECVCIHPNDSRFFGRDQVFPHLGFERFIDIEQFRHAEKAGAYISDLALYQYIKNFIEKRQTTRPLFLFVITMENHGPLHWENYDPESLNRLYQHTPPKQHHDLSVYLNHIQHADQMIQRLRQFLEQRTTPGLLTWYGDHVPSMPDIYRELDFKDPHSDYFIWHSQARHQPHPSSVARSAKNQSLDISELAMTLLHYAELTEK